MNLLVSVIPQYFKFRAVFPHTETDSGDDGSWWGASVSFGYTTYRDLSLCTEALSQKSTVRGPSHSSSGWLSQSTTRTSAMATKSLALRAIEERHMSKSAGIELCKVVAAARTEYQESRLFVILTKILRRIQIYCCFGWWQWGSKIKSITWTDRN